MSEIPDNLKDSVTEIGQGEITEAESQKKKSFDCGELKIEMKPPKKGAKSDNWTVNWKVGKKTGVIDPSHIWVIAWLISNDEMKEKLIPVKTTELKVFYKTIKLQLHNDMKKGQTIMTNVKFKVPMELLVQANESGIYTPKK